VDLSFPTENARALRRFRGERAYVPIKASAGVRSVGGGCRPGPVAAVLAMGAANAASAPTAAPAIHRSVRTVTKGAAIPFPTGQTVTPVQGIQNPEIPPEPEEEGDDAAAGRCSVTGRSSTACRTGPARR
jgi:hypothetical protein